MWKQPRIAVIIFFFNDTATTEIYTLSLHDALPISPSEPQESLRTTIDKPKQPTLPSSVEAKEVKPTKVKHVATDRKSTRLNSSHANISYAVFCLKKKTLLAHRACGMSAPHARYSGG